MAFFPLFSEGEGKRKEILRKDKQKKRTQRAKLKEENRKEKA